MSRQVLLTRWVPGILFLALLAAAAWVGVQLSLSDEPAGPRGQSRSPELVAVEIGDVRRTVIAPGQVVAASEPVVSSEVAGTVSEIFVGQGDLVERGDLIVRLDNSAAERDLEQARQQLVERGRELAGQIVVANLELDAARLRLAGASVATASSTHLALLENGVEQATLIVAHLEQSVPSSLQAAVDDAERVVAAHEVRSGVAGVVAWVTARPGQRLGAGEAIASIVDLSRSEIRVTVIEEDLPLVAVGQSAEVLLDSAPANEFAATVMRISPERVPGEPRPLYYVYLRLDPHDAQLAIGMTADTSLIVVQQSDVLRLPRAILRGGSGSQVRLDVSADGVIETRTVTVDVRGDVYASVAEGLQPGDFVVAK